MVWEWVSVPTDRPHEIIVTLLTHQQHTTYNINRDQHYYRQYLNPHHTGYFFVLISSPQNTVNQQIISRDLS